MSDAEAIIRTKIRDTMSRYNIAGDRVDIDAFLDVFTEDAVFTTGLFHCDGKAAIVEITKRWKNVPTKPVAKFVRHNLTTSQIDITGQRTADARTYYFVMTDIGPDHCGYYVDKYREEGGRWLICYRDAVLDWVNPASLFVPDRVKRRLAEINAHGGPFVPLGGGNRQ